MAPALRTFYTLAFTLHLPLLFIAFSAAVNPRDDWPILSTFDPGPSVVTGPNKQCIAAPWYSASNMLTHNYENAADMIILIETTLGAVLCFVPRSDLDKMLPGPIDESKYKELYHDRLIGKGGLLTERMLDLVRWTTDGEFKDKCAAPHMVVIDVQIAAPAHDDSFDHHILIRRMALDLRDIFKAALEKPPGLPDSELPPSMLYMEGWEKPSYMRDWKMPFYMLDSQGSGEVTIGKYATADSQGAAVWMTEMQKEKPLLNVELIAPTKYLIPGASPQGPWLAFEGGVPDYLGEMEFIPEQDQKSISRLYR